MSDVVSPFSPIEQIVRESVPQMCEVITDLGYGGGDVAMTHSLNSYIDRLEQVAVAANDEGWAGLATLCVASVGKIQERSTIHRPLSRMEREQLLTLASWIGDYVAHKGGHESSAALVAALCDLSWSKVLPDDDRDELIALLELISASGEEPAHQDNRPVETGEIQPLVIPVDLPLKEEEKFVDVLPQDEIDNEIAKTPDPIPEDQTASFSDLITTPNLVNPVQVSPELLGVLIDALVSEKDELGILVKTARDDLSGNTRAQALEQYGQHLLPLINGAEALGLAGLQEIFAFLQLNLMLLSTKIVEQPLASNVESCFLLWPERVLDYLESINDPMAATALVVFLQKNDWPQPLAEDDADLLINTLLAPQLTGETVSLQTRAATATPEDVTLQVPPDINPELLDSLLSELPQHTAEFAEAVHKIASGEGSLDDLTDAQRAAHTLKGAGNTVGIRGIASLTHHVEDILIAYGKQAQLPGKVLADILVRTSDCLEAMSESLAGIGEPPRDAQLLLQNILDWANRIDREGISEEDEPVEAEQRVEVKQELSAASVQQNTPQEGPEEAVASLRVPTTVVDTLMRLEGEGVILSGQIQDKLNRARGEMSSSHQQGDQLFELVTQLEHLVDIRGISLQMQHQMASSNFDALEFDQYNELHSLTRRLVEAATDLRQMGRDADMALAAINEMLVDQSKLQLATQDAIMQTRMVPVSTVVPRLQRAVRQTCRMLDKQAELVISGESTPLDTEVLNKLVTPLMHMLRNALDHGIEAADVRVQRGKSPVGKLALSFSREGNAIVIRLHDDGGGIDSQKIKQVAIEKGIISPDSQIVENELKRLIFRPGFSTQSETTQISGRGIGMDVVYSVVSAMKGAIDIETEIGQGTAFNIHIPVSLLSTHALLVHIGRHVMALSSHGIEQIVYTESGQIREEGDKLMYRLGEEWLPAVYMETLVNVPADRRHTKRHLRPGLVVQTGIGARTVVLVQEIVGANNVIVKALGVYVPKIPGVIGATILGDGDVSCVLDLPDLLRTYATGMWQIAPVDVADSAVQLPVILVVDDSLSVRRSMEQFLHDMGYEVRTARDGLEAAGLVEARAPHLMLVDLEMPRMNGLDLTSFVRNREASRHVPVIMITSRSTDKHRQLALQAGVNVYLTKPYTESELLEHIQSLIVEQSHG